MTLFDPSEYDDSIDVMLVERAGPWRVEVWLPVGAGWAPMDRVMSGGAREDGPWTFPLFDDALDAAAAWIAAGEVIDPQARIVHLPSGGVGWQSCGPEGPAATVPVSEKYL